MRGLLHSLRRGWRSLRTPSGPPVPFAVSCGCGLVQRGLRAARAQVVRCGGCGASLFVLPRSPLAPVPDDDGPAPTPDGAMPRRSPWLLPAAAAVATLAAVVLAYFVLFSSWLHPPGTAAERSAAEPPTPGAEKSMAAGRRLLREGNFRKALELLQAAHDRDRRNPELTQLYRQAQLLAQPLRCSLEDVVQQAQMVGDPDEWTAQFSDHKGNFVLFDDVVRREHKGEHHLAVYEVRAGGEKARVDLNLKLLAALPLEQPRRLLFGARLASVARGDGGLWVIRFDPASGVLLTDEGAAAACGLSLDAELRDLLSRQAEWARKLP